MRTLPLYTTVALGLWLGGVAPSHAATVTLNPADLQTGLGYEWKVVMGDNDSATYTGSVGAKSWAEPSNPVDTPGWVHTSDWTALDLTGVSGPTVLTLQLGRGATGSLFPAFSLYSGWETIVDDLNLHEFNNTGNLDWKDRITNPPTPMPSNLTYLDHTANVGGPFGNVIGTGVDSVSESWELAPGLYTLVYGGNPGWVPPLGQTGNHTFSATLTTAPVPVPAAAYLFGSGLIGLASLARRKFSA